MFFLLHRWIRWALLLFARRVVATNPESLHADGPLLLVSNHPNGFLDGIVIASLVRRPVHFLGSGEFFRGTRAWSLLRLFNVMPVYAAGREKQKQVWNTSAFDFCEDIWEKNGTVLLFAEGESRQGWGLRTLKKTGWRLADPHWQLRPGTTALKMVPVGLHYLPFTGTRKQILVSVGKPVAPLPADSSPAKRSWEFQERLRSALAACLLDRSAVAKYFEALGSAAPRGFLERWLLLLPAVAGWLLHAPLYLAARITVNRLVKRPELRESVLFVVLFFSYPLWYAALNLLAWLEWRNIWYSALLLLMPFWARCFILWRRSPR